MRGKDLLKPGRIKGGQVYEELKNMLRREMIHRKRQSLQGEQLGRDVQGDEHFTVCSVRSSSGSDIVQVGIMD